jgi:hypothetical protein
MLDGPGMCCRNLGQARRDRCFLETWYNQDLLQPSLIKRHNIPVSKSTTLLIISRFMEQSKTSAYL